MERCPNCWNTAVALASDGSAQAAGQPVASTELVLPFTLDEQALRQAVAGFSSGIPFAPSDLTAHNLAGRLKRVYIPAWLVDVDVEAGWEAETGFDYQVVSHQDRFDENRGGWTSQQVTEGRIRWEPRRGTLKRTYSNVTAPALEDATHLYRRLGGFRAEAARPYEGADLKDALIRQPDRHFEDAWQDVLPALQARAGAECCQAAGAEHIRQFDWSPTFTNQHWSLLLMPVYAAYYLDDAGISQAVQIHGQTGQIFGHRRASLQRAQRTALFVLLVAGLLFLAGVVLGGLGVVLPPLLPLGGGLVFLGFLAALGAVIPVGIVWQFNRTSR